VSEYTQGLLIVPSGECVVDDGDTVVITGGRFREAAPRLRGAVEGQASASRTGGEGAGKDCAAFTPRKGPQASQEI
jgi:hypothetical protein